jgi:hypothetical protein
MVKQWVVGRKIVGENMIKYIICIYEKVIMKLIKFVIKLKREEE